MEVLQVKQYHREIASGKQVKALERWREKNDGYGYPVNSMFFFMLEDKQGYPTENRNNGYVAFDDNKAVFGRSKDIAIENFNK